MTTTLKLDSFVNSPMPIVWLALEVPIASTGFQSFDVLMKYIWFQMDWNSVPVLQMNKFMCFWYSAIEAELEDAIPIIKTSVGGCSGVGRFCIGKVFFFKLLYRNEYCRSCGVFDKRSRQIICLIFFLYNCLIQKPTM